MKDEEGILLARFREVSLEQRKTLIKFAHTLAECTRTNYETH